MNFFNGFGGFGKHHDKGCGCNDGGDFMSFIMLFFIISCCGIDMCEILPLILLLSLLGSCCDNQKCGHYNKPY